MKVLECLKWVAVLGMCSLTAGCGASDSSGSPTLTENSNGATEDHATASTPPPTETPVPPGAAILGTLQSVG